MPGEERGDPLGPMVLNTGRSLGSPGSLRKICLSSILRYSDVIGPGLRAF